MRGQTGEGVSHYVPVSETSNGRRRFLRDVVRTAGGLAAVGVALGLQQQTARASGVRLRPPEP